MRRLLLPVLLVLGAVAVLASAPAIAGAAMPPVTFAAMPPTTVPGSSESLQGTIATADFNRDGHADVAAYSSNHQTEAHSLEVWLSGVGAGSTSWSWDSPLPTPSVPSFEAGYVATGQMDPGTDGDPDLVALSASGEEGESVLGVYLGNGIGTFQQPVETSLPGLANGRPTIADVNGDGIPDVLIPALAETGTGLESEVVTLLGEGNGHFEAPIVSPVAAGATAGDVFTTGIAVGDFTGSGHTDVAVSLGFSPAANLLVMAGDGEGGFAVAESFDLGAGSTGVVSGDFDGNGHADMAVPIGVPNFEHPEFDSGERVATVLGDGAGAFTALTPATPEWQAENPHSDGIATADLNGDGHPDLLLPVASDPDEGGVWALLGNGDGTFAEAARAELEGGNAWDAQSADFDGDGHGDIAALVDPTGLGELELVVYDNTSAPAFGLGAAVVDAGTVEVGEVGSASLPIVNGGNYVLSISSLSVAGADAGGFTVSGCGTVAPGATCDAQVSFRPSRIGAESATLTIATDDPAHPTATVALAGTGAVTTTAVVTGAGAGTGPEAPAVAGKLRLPKAATAKNGKASLGLSCTRGACSGRLTMTIATKKKVGGKSRTVAVTIGSARYSLAAGQSRTIPVKLAAVARRRLAAAPDHRLVASLTVNPSKGAKSTGRLTLVEAAPTKK